MDVVNVKMIPTGSSVVVGIRQKKTWWVYVKDDRESSQEHAQFRSKGRRIKAATG